MSPGHLTLEFFYLSILEETSGQTNNMPNRMGIIYHIWPENSLGTPQEELEDVDGSEGGLGYPAKTAANRTQPTWNAPENGHTNRSVSVLCFALMAKKNVQCSFES